MYYKYTLQDEWVSSDNGRLLSDGCFFVIIYVNSGFESNLISCGKYVVYVCYDDIILRATALDYMYFYT